MSTKRPRLSAEETRIRLCSAGVAALLRSGMSVGLDSINLEQAIRDADVSRSSAYAAWASDKYSPQEEFQRAVLFHAVESRKKTLGDLTASAGNAYAELEGTVSKRELLREIIRMSAIANVEAANASMGWRLIISLRGALNTAPEGERDEELSNWMNVVTEDIRDYTITSLYRPIAELFSLKPRPEYGDLAYAHGEACMAAVSDGFSMHSWLDSGSLLEGVENLYSDNREANWSMYGLVFDQMLEQFFVPESGSWDDFD